MAITTHRFTLLPLLLLLIVFFTGIFSKVHATNLSSNFATDLTKLQTQIGYKFKNIDLLGRAMTHASFSLENNKALSILGSQIIEASVSLELLVKDIDVSSKVMRRLIAEVSSVNTSCAVDGNQLGLEKIIRVSSKTDASNSGIVCGGFRAVFGAVAVDSGLVDDAVKVFWNVHGHRHRFGRLVVSM